MDYGKGVVRYVRGGMGVGWWMWVWLGVFSKSLRVMTDPVFFLKCSAAAKTTFIRSNEEPFWTAVRHRNVDYRMRLSRRVRAGK